MNMIEKAARAIAYSTGSHMVGPGANRASREFGWKGDGEHFEQYAEAHWREHVSTASLVVGAMREPTQEMIARGIEIDPGQTGNDITEIWQAMIDVASDDR